MPPSRSRTVISPVLIVPDGAAAADWYAGVLGARELFRVGDGHLVALDVDGAPFVVREQTPPGRVSPAAVGRAATACVELFTVDPDAVAERAARRGDRTDRAASPTPGGPAWLAGDMSPLSVSPRS